MASHIVKDQVKCSMCKFWKPSISSVLRNGKIFCRRCVKRIEKWEEYLATLED